MKLSNESNCMTVIVGRAASETGRVLVAHNEDDYIHAKVKHHFVPARDWPEGTLLPAEEGLTRIPQVSHTLAYSWVEITGQSGGLSTSDCFLNEKGVCVISDSSCGSIEDACDPKLCSDGIVYELRRAVAERAESARDAYRIARELVDKYGYASPGRIYFFADKDSAYMLQLARGRSYAGCRLPDDCAIVMPNHFTIHGLSGLEEAVYPEGLIERAIDKGWYKPQTSDCSDFDFARAYRNPGTYMHSENTLRQKYATQLLLGREWSIDTDGFPPYVRPAAPIGIAKIMEVMSTHYEGTDSDVRFGPGLSPHNTCVRRVCTGTTVESMIFEFTDMPLMTTVWTTFGRPCELIYLPLHPLCGELKQLEAHEDPYEAARTHFLKKPFNTCFKPDGWQKTQNFQNLAELKYSGSIASIKRMKQAAFEYLKKSESDLRQDFDADKANASDNCAFEYSLKAMDEYMASEPHLINAEVIEARITRGEGVSKAHVLFSYDSAPDEASMLFGPGRTELHRDYAAPVFGSLRRKNDGLWSMSFVFSGKPLSEDGEGEYEFILGGRDLCALVIMRLNEDGNGQKA